jgi:hypothetical protein
VSELLLTSEWALCDIESEAVVRDFLVDMILDEPDFLLQECCHLGVCCSLTV